MQDALRRLSDYWTDRGALTWQPFNSEVGAGTMNLATVLRVLGPEPWDVAYVEPSVRPDDSRYGENPNRLATHTQFQVVLKPERGNPQELYLGSLEALGIDLSAHDVRFVEDNWAQPAIGAWGLGWEVWLDGMEITQFTYFQQVGGQDLDPVPVELTYGMERILMAVQGVTHFKDIVYATKADGTVVTYGEALGQQEYEMSRYYLDDADVETNRTLYESYVAEAGRMVAARLPVPAHYLILKSSHAFNVLDARGAISTTERAQAFGAMRRLMRDTATLWVERRTELGLPLLKQTRAPAVHLPAVPCELPDAAQPFALEIGVEELPPHVLPATIEQVRESVTRLLQASRLEHGAISVDGTPRRVVLTVADVAVREPDSIEHRKGPKWAVAFDADGNPSKALQGFMRGQGVELDQLERVEIGGNEHVAVASTRVGRGALEVLGEIVAQTVSGLRSEKNMRWSDPELSFSRAIRWLVALWGPVVVPVAVSRLVAGRTTYLQRTTGGAHSATRSDGAALGHVEVAAADQLERTIATGGIRLSTAQRREAVVEHAVALAGGVGGSVDIEGEADLIDEITNLVEDPHGVLGSFDARYLELPDRVLVTVMRKHQRYLPVRDSDGALMPHFITMANGLCDDRVVRAGNESVLRARYEDALFFWNADLRCDSVEEFVPGLEALTFENRLGSVGERARRVADVATVLADEVDLSKADRSTLTRAGRLAKFDLATQMVVEMSALAGFVAREYALRKGEPQAVADALAELEMPRTASGELPAGTPGALLAVADRADLLTAMFALGAKPSGSADPYGLRRAALGLARILREHGGQGPLAALSIRGTLAAAAARLRHQGIDVSEESVEAAAEFVVARFAQLLRDEGRSADVVSAVLPSADRPAVADAHAAALTDLAGDAGFRRVVEAVVRIVRIVPAGTVATYDEALLTEPAEKAMADAITATPESADLSSFASGHAGLVAPIARFFDDILVMADDPALASTRLGLLATVIDKAPAGLDWKAVDAATA